MNNISDHTDCLDPTDCLDLTDGALLEAVTANLARESRGLAELIVFLGEVERRKLYLERAHPSLFAFCTHELGFSEGAAYRRIGAARLARRFPAVVRFIASGHVHLTGLNVLAPALTDSNHLELLRAATGQTKRQIQELVAAKCPRPEPVTSARKLPARARTQQRAAPETAGEPARPQAATGKLELRPPVTSSTVEPVSAQRYAVRFTASKSLVDKLDELAALRSHRPAEARAVDNMLEEAVDLLIAKERKARFAVGRKPRAGAASPQPSEANKQSRHIPAAVRREVYERDGGCCQFLHPETGRRCGARWQVTYEHKVPVALGGTHSAEQVVLLCAAHNRLMADRVFGPDAMQTKVEAARATRRNRATTPTHAGISSEGSTAQGRSAA